MLRPGTLALTALLAALTAIAPITTDMYLPSLPDIARHFNTTAAEVQLTLSAYLLGFACGQVVYGPLSDRYGRKPVLIGSLLIFSIGSIGCVFAPSMKMLIAARAVQAIGAAGCIVLTRAVVRDLYSGARAGREMSLIAAAMAIAPTVAPTIGGALHVAFGWQSNFIVILIVGFLGILAVWLLLPETLKAGRGEPISIGSILRSYGIVLRNPVFLSNLAICSACYSGLFVWISGSSFTLQDVFGMSPLYYGLAFGFGAAGYMTGSVMSAHLVTRIGLNAVIGMGGGLATAGGILMVIGIAAGLRPELSLVTPMIVYLAGLGMVMPQTIAGAMTPFPERAGAASSMFGFAQQCIASAWGALIGQFVGWSAWPLVIMIATLGAATLIAWFVTRRIRAAA